MKRILIAMMLLGGATVLGGCDTLRESFGLNKRAPDEFAVYQRDPLVMPREFELPTPVPGATRADLSGPRDKALQATFGNRSAGIAAAPEAESDGLAAFKREIGALRTDPQIRQVVNEEDAILEEEDKSIADRFRFWGTDTVWGLAVDPEKEARRLQANRALGKPINEGEVPTLARKRKALLEGLL